MATEAQIRNTLINAGAVRARVTFRNPQQVTFVVTMTRKDYDSLEKDLEGLGGYLHELELEERGEQGEGKYYLYTLVFTLTK